MLSAFVALATMAQPTAMKQPFGTIIPATDRHIQYVGLHHSFDKQSQSHTARQND